MTDAPLPPPHKDWQSPEFGEALRAILDVHDGIREPQAVVAQRFARLGDMLRTQPEVVVGAFFALLNAALSLPQMLPAPIEDIPRVREQLERKVYADVNDMPPPLPDV